MEDTIIYEHDIELGVDTENFDEAWKPYSEDFDQESSISNIDNT